MNVSQMVNAACRQLGFTPTAAEAADAMEALNLMLQEWAATPNGIHSETRENFALSSGVSEYAIGSGATLNTVRPSRIESAFIRDSIDYPMTVYHALSEYAPIAVKDTAGMPCRLYLDRAYPDANIFLYPTPDDNYDLHLYSFKPLATYTSLSDDVGLPPEYEPAIKFNLAVDLAEEFGKTLSPVTLKRADDTLKALKRINAGPVSQINTNPFGGCGRRYDISTDTYP